MPVTTNKNTPNIADRPEEGPISAIYIEHTKGVWIRHNLETKEIELWHDGHFHMAWADAGGITGRPKVDENWLHAHVATAMIAEGISIGKRLRSKEISKLING